MEVYNTNSELELSEVTPRWKEFRRNFSRKNLSQEQENSRADVEDNAIIKKWQFTAKEALERQKSWKLIDGEVDEIRWSSNDGWWKWIKRLLSIANLLVMGVCFGLLFSTCYFSMSRFLSKETTTLVRVKPTSDPETTFVSFTICPQYHNAYKKSSLERYNITPNEYRYGSVWYPQQDIESKINGTKIFHEVTYELHEIIQNIEIGTMSLTQPKIVIDPVKEVDKEYVVFATKYMDTFGRCYTMTPARSLLALRLTKFEFVTRIAVYVFLDHPGQHLHDNSRAKVYSDLGKKHYVDVHFDLNINTWTESKDIPCNPLMNEKFDEFLYQNLSHTLETEFNCTVPFLPSHTSAENRTQMEICQDPKKRKASYKRYKLLKRNKENALCENPCSQMRIYFGILFKDPKFVKNRALIKIYLQSMTVIKLTVMNYSWGDMLADFGGYIGLFLGMSAVHLSKFIFRSILKVVRGPRKKKGQGVSKNNIV